MKNKVVKQLVFVMAVCAAAMAGRAATEVVDGITWTYTVSEGKVSVGGGSLSSTAVPTSTKDAIAIPTTLGGFPVTSIGYGAFYHCSGLTNVTIPDGVTNIDQFAFGGCSGLTSVVIPEGVTSIEMCAFYGCSKLTSVTIPSSVTNMGYEAFRKCSGLTNVTISEGVTSIGHRVFQDCSGLTSVTIPDSMTSIGAYAFYGCSGLGDGVVIRNNCVLTINGTCPISVELPIGTRVIAGGAFSGCGGLKSVTIPDSVKSIGASAFYYCSGLTSVTIPEGVTRIDDYAFCDCSELTNVTIPSSVTSIGESAFYDCSGLKNITIPSSMMSIGHEAFVCCMGLTNVVFGGNAPTVGYEPFYAVADGCTATVKWGTSGWDDDGDGMWQGLTLNWVGRPKFAFTAVGYEGAYDGMGHGITVTVTEPAEGAVVTYSLTKGGEYMSMPILFTNVTDGAQSVHFKILVEGQALTNGMATVTITRKPDGGPYTETVDGIEWTYTVSDGKASVGGGNWDAARAVPDSTTGVITIPSTLGECPVTSIGEYAFYDCGGLTSVTIPEGVTSIGDDAFTSCYGLMSVTIPSSVTSIGDGAFEGCIGLTSVTIPSSVTSIGNNAFYWCRGLTNVVMSEGVTSIGDYAFSWCDGLTSVTILSSVWWMGRDAFEECSSLTNFTFGGDAPEVFDYNFYDYYVFLNLANDCTATVIRGTWGWDDDGDGTWRGLTLRWVNRPIAFTAIGYEGAYDGRGHGVTVNVTEPAEGAVVTYSLTEGGEYAATPILLTNVTDGAQSVYFMITAENYEPTCGMATVEILSHRSDGGPYTEIVDGLEWTFMVSGGKASVGGGDYYLPAVPRSTAGTITIPSTLGGWPVTSISYQAFSCCDGLTSVTIPNGVTSIGGYAFEWCEGLKSVTIPEGVTSIGDGTFYNCSGLTSVTIPEGVTSIEYCTFYYCSGLTSVTIPSSVTRIGECAFNCCKGLTSMTIPSSVTSIGRYAFGGCSGLTSVTIPSSVTSIEYGTFYNCSGLTSVTIPSSVTNIGDCAFEGCRGLTNVVFDGDAPTAGYYAFSSVASGCTATVYKGTTGWDDDGDGKWQGLTLRWVDKIAYTAVGYEDACDGLGHGITVNVTKPTEGASVIYSLTEDGDYTTTPILFTNVTDGVQSVYFKITADGYATASGVATVTIVRKPDGGPYTQTVDGIEWTYTVSDGTASVGGGLNSPAVPTATAGVIAVPAMLGGCPVTNIGEGAFRGCNGLTSIVFDGDAPAVDVNAFEGVADGCLAAVYKGTTGWDDDGDGKWQGLTLHWLDRPKIVFSTVGHEGTYDGTGHGITVNVTEPANGATVTYSLTENGEYTPMTILLTNVTDGVQGVYFRIAAEGYASTNGVVPVSIAPRPATLTSGSVTKKYDGTALTCETVTQTGFVGDEGVDCTVTGSQTAVGESANAFDYAFKSNTKAANYTITKAEGVLTVVPSDIVFKAKRCEAMCDGMGHGITVNVTEPAEGAVVTYSLTEDGEYTATPILFTNVTDGAYSVYFKIAAEGYLPTNGVATVEILSHMPDGGPYTEIVNGLEWTYTVSDGKASVGGGNWDARAVPASTSGAITVPSILGSCPVTSIGSDAFYNCSGLTSVTIPEGVTSIGYNAFECCHELVSVTIPESVTYIGDYSFCDSGKLTDIILPSKLTYLGAACFCSCSSLVRIAVPGGVKLLGDYYCGCSTFMDCTSLQEVVIAAGVELIPVCAFARCSSLTNVIFGGDAPTVYRDNAFGGVADGCTATVYKGTSGWDDDGDGKWQGLTLKWVDGSKIAFRVIGHEGVYDGTGHGITVNVTEPANGSVVTYSLTEDGEYTTMPILLTNVADGVQSVYFRITAEDHEPTNGVATVTIAPKTLTGEMVTLDATASTYDGTAKCPTVTVADGEPPIITTDDYTVAYTNNVNAGTASVIVTGKGNYTGSVTKGFTIAKAQATVTAEAKSRVYGDADVPLTYQVAGLVGDDTLSGELTRAAGADVGTYAIGQGTVGNANYTVAFTGADYTITPKTLTEEMVTLDAAVYTYDGTAKCPAVTVADGEPSIITTSDYTVVYASNVDAGTATVTVTGKGNYTGSVMKNFTIAKATYDMTGVAWDYGGGFVYDGTEKSIALTGLPSGVTATYEGGAATDAGSYTAKAIFSHDAMNYNAPIVDDCLWMIAPRPATLTSGSATKKYDGTALTCGTVTQTGFVGDEGVECTVTGSQTAVGESANAFGYTFKANTKAANYAITKTEGTLTVTPGDIAFEATDCETTYDGTGHGIAVNVMEPAEGAVVTYSLTEDGEYTATPMLFTNVTDGAQSVYFKITADNYEPTNGMATVTIMPKGLTADMVGDIGEQTYTGAAIEPFVTVADELPCVITADGYTIAYSDNVNAGIGRVIVTGKGNYAGTIEKTFTIRKASYDMGGVAWKYGGGFVYDGTEKFVTLTGLPSGVTVTYEGGDATDAGSYTAKAAFAYDAANYNTPIVDDCAWTIVPRPATVTSGSATKKYDGTALTCGTVTQTGFVGDEGVDCEVTGSQTDVGESANAFGYTFKANTKASNYTITKTEGTLTVTPADIVFTVSNCEATYDGTGHGITVNVTDPSEGAVVAYSLTEDGEYTATPILFTNVTDGAQRVYFRITAENYLPTNGMATVTVEPQSDGGPYTETVDGIEWTYTVSGGEASVGKGGYGGTAVPQSTKGAIVIPSTLGGCPVTSIGGYAFYNCSTLMRVLIPEGVKSIGGYAFYGCTLLEDVSIPETVKECSGTAFENSAFWNGFKGDFVVINSMLLGYSGTCPEEIVIPDGVTEVCDNAFWGESITKVTFPNSLVKIGDQAFYRCHIRSLQLPSGLKHVGKNAFDGNHCSDSRYYRYGYLKSVSIEGAQDLVIDEYAFYGQPVTDVRISGTNIVIGAFAFKSADYWRAYDTTYWSATISLTGSNIRIGDQAFYDMSYGYVNLDLSGVVSIGAKAFYGLSNYYRTSDTTWYEYGSATVKLPNALESVGDGAFEYTCIHTICVDSLDAFLYEDILSSLRPMWTYYYGVKVGDAQDWLPALTVPEGWTKIPDHAFRGMCVEAMTIPASVREIGSKALSYNTFLTNMTFYGDAPVLGDDVFDQDARYSREYVVKNWYKTCTVTVMDKAKGWDDDGDGKWQGFNLRYMPSCEVTFKVDDYLMRYMTTDESRLDQYVARGDRALVPEFDFPGSVWFVGENGNADSPVTDDVEYVARYETSDIACAFGSGNAATASTGGKTNWMYRVVADDDRCLVSGRFTGRGESWMELAVTNDAKVAFDCKASTLRLNNKAINTFKCYTNGVEVLAMDGNTDWQHSAWEVPAGTVIRWVYSQVATYGSDYENCGWVRNLTVYPKVTVSFASDAEIMGKLPDEVVVYADKSVVMPDGAGFGRACHTFAGWSDGVSTYVPGESYDGTNGSVTLSAVWTANTLTPPNIGAQETYAALAQSVTLADDNDGATLYYSVNGSPFAAYAGAFDVTGEAVIRAYAAKDNYFSSATNEIAVTRQQYAVTFAAGAYGSITDGETTQQVRYGDDAAPVAVAADKWHDFTGWDGATTGITSARDLMAQYAPKTFALNFGGENITWQYGDELIGPTPTLAKHRLVGWTYQGTNYVAGSVLPFDGEDTSYTAVWEEKRLAAPVIDMPDTYDGERCTATVTAQEGATIRCKIGDGAWFDYAGAFDVVGSATVTAYAVQDDWYDSDCAVRATVRGPWTFGEYLGASNVVFTSSGDGEWYRTNEVGGVAGYYLTCGDMRDNETGTLSATFHGKGTIRFRFRTSVESWPDVMDFDYFVFKDNGEDIAAWSGETGWREAAFELTGDGEHVVSWSYIKDEGDTFEADFDNCVWLDSVTWTAEGPKVADDPGATVTGDVASGYTVRPSEGKKRVEVTIPAGVEAEKVTVEVGADVETVKPNGAKVKVVRGTHDITGYLDIPAADAGGNVDLTKAAVKESVVKEALDPEKGAEITLDPSNVKLQTSNTKPGLTYTFSEGTTLKGLTQKSSKVGDGSAWTPEVSVKGGSSGFYSIGVKK